MSPNQSDSASDSPAFESLRAKLAGCQAEFSVLRHMPVFTSEEAAAVRGTPLASGAKALILSLDGNCSLFVLPADRKLDSRKLRTATSTKSLRFASLDEVLALTGLKPGSIPPFGSLFGLATSCDPALGLSESINFNAGDHSISISMPYAEYLRVEAPRLIEFSASS